MILWERHSLCVLDQLEGNKTQLICSHFWKHCEIPQFLYPDQAFQCLESFTRLFTAAWLGYCLTETASSRLHIFKVPPCTCIGARIAENVRFAKVAQSFKSSAQCCVSTICLWCSQRDTEKHFNLEDFRRKFLSRQRFSLTKG